MTLITYTTRDNEYTSSANAFLYQAYQFPVANTCSSFLLREDGRGDALKWKDDLFLSIKGGKFFASVFFF
ncbi:hypothetical protein [uncultured Akkermansia sp.]|uniref:hypothetical protein n=1 Tax=uncultured Akkermansia sp. TaxID=512294 RepID=UPI00265D31AD|nr:hypothetical protein [uncultured Akkermansia sp.]